MEAWLKLEIVMDKTLKAQLMFRRERLRQVVKSSRSCARVIVHIFSSFLSCGQKQGL